MTPRCPLALPLIITLALALRSTGAHADDEPAGARPDPTRVAALVSRLGDEECSVRGAAQRELRELGPEIHPLLDRALRRARDPEVRMALEDIIGELLADRWLTEPDAALREAEATGKPLLLIVLADDEEDQHALSRLVRDPRVTLHLARHLVLGCIVAEEKADERGIAVYATRSGVLLCEPGGRVVTELHGKWSARMLLEIADATRKALAESDDPAGAAGRLTRVAAARRWRVEAVERDRGTEHEPLDERLRRHVYIGEWIY